MQRAQAGTIEGLLTPHGAPPHAVVVTALASYAAIGLALVAGWPAWAVVSAAVAPWLVIFSTELAWAYRHFHWLALFYVLAATQGGHLVEHIVQVTQIHVLGRTGHAAHGIFGRLDIEWVHFAWNSWVFIAVAALLLRYRRNPWLWAAMAFAAWHQVEHTFILWKYLQTGVAGTPGLLSAGGALAGGLGLKRPDLHLLYNVVETVPLFVALGWTLRRTHDEWLARALPHAEVDVLVDATKVASTERFAVGDVIVRQGDVADRFFVLVRGEVEVLVAASDGAETVLRRLMPGDFFGEMGLLDPRVGARTATVRAATPVEVLCLERDDFFTLVSRSNATADDLARIAADRAREQRRTATSNRA